jgi:hypothetical protein
MAVLCQKLIHSRWPSLSGCSAVLADQAAEDLSALDPGGDTGSAAELTLRRLLLQALVRPVAVRVPGELGYDFPEMLLAEDQDVIEALAAKRQKIACLLGGPGASQMSRDAHDMDGAGLDLHHEQHVHAPQQHGVHVQEVTSHDPGRLGGQELPPRRRCPPRRWPESGGGQDAADRPLPTR